CYRDWSSDVCSSDLAVGRIVVSVRPDSELGIVRQRAVEVELVAVVAAGGIRAGRDGDALLVAGEAAVELQLADQPASRQLVVQRSEERRVGKAVQYV